MEPLDYGTYSGTTGKLCHGPLGKTSPVTSLSESPISRRPGIPPRCPYVPALPPTERSPVVKSRGQPHPSLHQAFGGRTLGTTEIIFNLS